MTARISSTAFRTQNNHATRATMKLRLLCLALAATSVVQAATTAPVITIPGDKIFPESLTSTADGSVIFGSIGARTVFRAKPGSATAEPWIKPGTDGMRSVLGV